MTIVANNSQSPYLVVIIMESTVPQTAVCFALHEMTQTVTLSVIVMATECVWRATGMLPLAAQSVPLLLDAVRNTFKIHQVLYLTKLHDIYIPKLIQDHIDEWSSIIDFINRMYAHAYIYGSVAIQSKSQVFERLEIGIDSLYS